MAVWHGPIDRADAILAAHPEVAGANIYTASVLGDEARVRRFAASDPASATAKGGAREWDALTHLCFSKYLARDRERADAFVRTAQALLDAGASASTGFWEPNHQPEPVWEAALYGAAGIAHHPELTALLLANGADPNDEETPYHSPETYDNGALAVLVESGKLTEESMTTMLLRKADWHDLEGIRYLLAHGADPNRGSRWGYTALQQAIRRDNHLKIIEAMLDAGADPALISREGRNAIASAARRGRGDVLAEFERRGIAIELAGADRLIAACARGEAGSARKDSAAMGELLGEGGALLAQFAAVDNAAGVRSLLDLGVDAASVWTEGDPYFGIAQRSTALHAAAWRAAHGAVKLLIERGTPLDAVDGKGRTALMLAVRACVDSYWTHRRSPESVAALLAAGASKAGVAYPCGYEAVDALLDHAE